MDGLEDRGNVAVVATTNRIDCVDPALLRPGRFDYHIEVPTPTEEGRESILRLHLSKMKTDQGLSCSLIAAETEGFSGADVANLCREAGLEAIRRGISGGVQLEDLRVTAKDIVRAMAAIQEKRIADR